MPDHYPFIQYPAIRMRRLRQKSFLRQLVQENQLDSSHLIQPFFITEPAGARIAIPSMPGIDRFGIEQLLPELERCQQLGIPMIALFPAIEDAYKTPDGRAACDSNGLIQKTIRRIKQHFPALGIMADVALDPYTTHGQDGIIDDHGQILNDETIAVLIEQGLSHAAAGADMIAPSDMMDGRIGALRSALEKEGFQNTIIMSYAAKYASGFYGPFRDAVGSKVKSGQTDKRTYQMNPGNFHEALREAALDVSEGADILMVKPGLPYLDVIAAIKQQFGLPVFAYQVSGEYSMLCAAAGHGWLDERACVLESLLCLRRAGADGIVTYHATRAAQWLFDASKGR